MIVTVVVDEEEYSEDITEEWMEFEQRLYPERIKKLEEMLKQNRIIRALYGSYLSMKEEE